jgi:hypothetical protein
MRASACSFNKQMLNKRKVYMKNSRFALLHNSLLLNLRLILALVFASMVVLGQEKTVTRRTETGNNVGISINKYDEIPEATEPCTPTECEWWKQLRQAGNDLQRKGDEKSKRKFVLLFVEGLEKSYRVPLKDSPPKVLVSRKVEILDVMKVRKINGEVELSVEYRADGSIGEIKVIKALNPTIDNRVIQAVRQYIFLPAIKDGAFVTEWHKGGLKISTQNK